VSEALAQVAAKLREDPVIGPHVADARAGSPWGALAAAGPRASSAPGEYAFLFEAIREGKLVHYDEPRLLAAADPDLRLLAGDYLYALGLERLAALGDLEAVRELADLISLTATLEARAEDGGGRDGAVDALWLGSAVAVGAGGTDAHRRAKAAVLDDAPGVTELLWESAAASAAAAGFGDALAAAADSIGFAAQDLLDSG